MYVYIYIYMMYVKQNHVCLYIYIYICISICTYYVYKYNVIIHYMLYIWKYFYVYHISRLLTDNLCVKSVCSDWSDWFYICTNAEVTCFLELPQLLLLALCCMLYILPATQPWHLEILLKGMTERQFQVQLRCRNGWMRLQINRQVDRIHRTFDQCVLKLVRSAEQEHRGVNTFIKNTAASIATALSSKQSTVRSPAWMPVKREPTYFSYFRLPDHQAPNLVTVYIYIYVLYIYVYD